MRTTTPTDEGDRAYFARRAAEQRARAALARHPEAAAAHHRLADLLAAATRPARPVLHLFASDGSR